MCVCGCIPCCWFHKVHNTYSAICVEVCPLAALAVNVPKPIHPGYVDRVARKKHRPGTSIVGVRGDL